MKALAIFLGIFLGVPFASAQYAPVVTVDHITIAHEQRGWRVVTASHTDFQADFNLVKNDLIIRIDAKNASETGPMQMATLFNTGLRQNVNVFLERGNDHVETLLRKILPRDYAPVGSKPFRHVKQGFSAPDFVLTDIDHHPATLDQYKNKWLLINFVGTWCAPCMASFPQVADFAAHHHLNLLLVALNDKEPALRRLKQHYNLDTPIVMQDAMAPLPVDFGVVTSLHTGQVPALVLIDPDGDVAFIDIGGDWQDAEQQLVAQLRHRDNPPVR
jgi:thiol-disulfide isomerase/thioredoxin